MENKSTRQINALTGWLVGLLAVIAFVLSYNALREVAFYYGVPGLLSYAWPLLVDFALIVFSLAVLRASLLRERTIWPWLLVGLFTLATIGFNLIHAQVDAISRIVAIVPPVALFLSFETLMGMTKAGVRRAAVVASTQQLNANLTQLTGEVDALKSTLEALEMDREYLQGEINRLTDEKSVLIDGKAKEAGVSTETIEKARAALSGYQVDGLPLPSGAKLGQDIGVSRTTGSKLMALLGPEFVNGNGVGK